MKRIKLLTLLLSICTILVLTESCNKDEPCTMMGCNMGTLNLETCVCDCPTGYMGANCEQIDTTQIQALLDADVTPKTLFDGGVSLEQLYGKMYKGGLIFYLDTTEGTGMVAATKDQGESVKWGCFFIDIANLPNIIGWPEPGPETEEGARIGDGMANTNAILTECTEDGIAAKLCRDEGFDYFLPSRGELNQMYTNLHAKGYGGFASGYYWSSSENYKDVAWRQNFNNGYQDYDIKAFDYYVRAVRAF